MVYALLGNGLVEVGSSVPSPCMSRWNNNRQALALRLNWWWHRAIHARTDAENFIGKDNVPTILVAWQCSPAKSACYMQRCLLTPEALRLLRTKIGTALPWKSREISNRAS